MFIIPTMNRAAQCKAMVDQAMKMDPSAHLCVFVNGKSHEEEYRELFKPNDEMLTVIYHEENIGALGALNNIFERFRRAKYFGFIGDDEWIETPNWSRGLIEQAGDWYISHANDRWQSGFRIHSHVCIGGILARTVGYLSIPGCWHWYGFDTLWEIIGKSLGLQRFCHDIKSEHRHPLNGKTQVHFDECYKIGESKKEKDGEIMQKWMAENKSDIFDRIMKRLNA